MIFYRDLQLQDQEIYLSLDKTEGENKEKMYVPAYYFKICRCTDHKELGKCSLRVGHNENTYYVGNIGYEVYEEHRGHHYAGKACKLLIPLAKKHNLDYLTITCGTKNAASQRTCSYCGAVFEGIVTIPEWNDMYKMGRRESCQYRLSLEEHYD